MKIIQQEKEHPVTLLGSLSPADVCWINGVLYMVIKPSTPTTVMVFKLRTGEVNYFTNDTHAEPADCALIVNV